jgi:hypothetical protein
LNAVEEHLLICGECVNRAPASDAYVDRIRSALVRCGFALLLFAFAATPRKEPVYLKFSDELLCEPAAYAPAAHPAALHSGTIRPATSDAS